MRLRRTLAAPAPLRSRSGRPNSSASASSSTLAAPPARRASLRRATAMRLSSTFLLLPLLLLAAAPQSANALSCELSHVDCETVEWKITLHSKDPSSISYVQFYVGEVSMLPKGGWAQNISLSGLVDQYTGPSSNSSLATVAKNVTTDGAADVFALEVDLMFDYQRRIYFATMADDGAQPVGWRAFDMDGRPQIAYHSNNYYDHGGNSKKRQHSKRKGKTTGMKEVLGEESRRIFGKSCQGTRMKAALTDDGDDGGPGGAVGNVTIGFTETIGAGVPADGDAGNGGGGGGAPVGAITGGVLGGFLGGLFVAFILWFARRRRARKAQAGLLSSNNDDDDDEKPSFSSFNPSSASSSSALARARAWTRRRRRGITWEDAAPHSSSSRAAAAAAGGEQEAADMEAGRLLLSPSDVIAQNVALPPGSRPPIATASAFGESSRGSGAGGRAGRAMLQLDTSPATLAPRRHQQQQQRSLLTGDLLHSGLDTATDENSAELSYFSPLQPLDSHQHPAWDMLAPPPEYVASVRSSEVVLPSPAWPNQNTTLASLNRSSNGNSGGGSSNNTTNSNATTSTPISSGPFSSTTTVFNDTLPTTAPPPTAPPPTATDEKRRHVFPRTTASDSSEELLTPFSPTLTERRPSTATVGTTRMVLDAIIVSSEGDQDESAFWAERED